MIKCKNLYLRSIENRDLPDIYTIILKDGIGSAYSTTHYELTLGTLSNQLFDRQEGTDSKVFVVKKGKETIGFVTLNDIHPIRRSAQVGAIGLKKEYRGDRKEGFFGKSYALEIAGAIVVYAFEVLNLHKLTAHTFNDNSNMDNTYRIGGFKKEGEKQDFIPKNGKWLNRLDWALLRKEYDELDNYKEFKKFIDWK